MSKARVVITAVVVEGRRPAEVAKTYGLSKSWVCELVARYRTEGDAAFEPRSTRPVTRPRQTPPEHAEFVVNLRHSLTRQGLDAGPPIILLVHDLDVRVVHAATGEIIRQLTIDTTRTYQPTGNKQGGPNRPHGPRKKKQPEP